LEGKPPSQQFGAAEVNVTATADLTEASSIPLSPKVQVNKDEPAIMDLRLAVATENFPNNL